MRPQSDDFDHHIEQAVRAFVADGYDSGLSALSEIAVEPKELPKRPSIGRKRQCTIYRRDHFTCRYCGGRTIVPPVMEILGHLYPTSFPFENDHWRGGVTHPAFLARSPTVDHVVPGSMGGSWTSEDNLVTACWLCNGIKADFSLDQLGWVLREPIQGWDGLSSLYREFWEKADCPRPERHLSWLRDLNV